MAGLTFSAAESVVKYAEMLKQKKVRSVPALSEPKAIADLLYTEINKPPENEEDPAPVKVIAIGQYVLLGIHTDILTGMYERAYEDILLMSENLYQGWGYDALLVTSFNGELKVWTWYSKDCRDKETEHLVSCGDYRFRYAILYGAMVDPEKYMKDVLNDVASAFAKIASNTLIRNVTLTTF
jgi:hypothetical protein